MDKIAVVILNWNGRKFLEQFLPSVVQNSAGAKIFVADNNSSDDSVEFVKTNFPEVSLILISHNEGYSEGYNIALKQIEAKYYVLLNSDVEVTSDWLKPLAEIMDGNDQIAACQPKIKSYFEKNKFEYAGAAGGFIDKWGYPFCRGRIFDTIEKDEGQYNDIREIFWASGACLFIRSESFHKMGGLDKDFFAHMEEIDLCWRLQNAGYKIFYCGKSEVYHVGGGSLSKSDPHKTYLNFRNNLSLLYKNLPDKNFYVIFFLRLILDGMAGLKFLFTDSIMHSFAVVKAHFSTYRNIGKLKRKRKALKVKGSIKIKTIYTHSIACDYFIRKKRKFSDLEF
jgi:GT2 family glycosyltransferase